MECPMIRSPACRSPRQQGWLAADARLPVTGRGGEEEDGGPGEYVKDKRM